MAEALLVPESDPEEELEGLEVSLLVLVEEALLVSDSESEREVEAPGDSLKLCDGEPEGVTEGVEEGLEIGSHFVIESPKVSRRGWRFRCSFLWSKCCLSPMVKRRGKLKRWGIGLHFVIERLKVSLRGWKFHCSFLSQNHCLSLMVIVPTET